VDSADRRYRTGSEHGQHYFSLSGVQEESDATAPSKARTARGRGVR